MEYEMNTLNEERSKYSQLFSSNPPSCFIENFDKVKFVQSKREYRVPPRFIKNGIIMVFKEPIWFDDHFQLIPGYVDFAINELSQVMSIKTGKLLSQYDSNGYVHCSLGDVSVPLHRLIALVYVANSCWETNHLVNHINGVKHDNECANLEWCDYSDNNKHAARNGLTQGVISARVRDISTGVVTQFATLGHVSEFLGSPQTIIASRFINRSVTKLFNGRYEVRIDGDDRPWYYIGSTTPEITKASPVRPVEVLHVDECIISRHDSIRAASRELGIAYNIIHSAIQYNDGRCIDGKVYRYISSEPWVVNHDYKVKSISIDAVKNGEVKTFNSLKASARFFNCDRSKIKTHIRDRKTIDGWLLSYTD